MRPSILFLNILTNMTKQTIFLLAGRTGGPIMPLLATFRGILTIEKKNKNNHKVENKFDSKEIESQFEAVIIGVKNGFEEKLAKQENLKLEFLPEAKLELLSFSFHFKSPKNWKYNLSQIGEFVAGVGKSVGMIFLLLASFVQSFWLIWKYKPTAILSSGSFLAIPVLWSAFLCNFFNFKNIFGKKILIITHQQDPIPGLASRLTFGLGLVQTCVFEYSKNWKKFQKAKIIPNPIDFSKFYQKNPENPENKELANFLNIGLNPNLEMDLETDLEKENKPNEKSPELKQDLQKSLEKKGKLPLFLIFGGGSGSEFINNWVWQNLVDLTQNFRILHLSGIHTKSEKASQTKDKVLFQKNLNVSNYTSNSQVSKLNLVKKIKDSNSKIETPDLNSIFPSLNQKNQNYLQIPSLLGDMPLALQSADLVMCRSGLGSISELLYLNKPSFLVPLENSHQEKNAQVVRDYFGILEQKDSEKWLEIIIKNYPQKFAKINYPSPSQIQKHLNTYYQNVYNLITKNN